MWLKNVAGQGFSFTIPSRMDGTDLTSGTVTVTRRLDGGTPGAAGGTVTLTDGNGYYAASQADTNASVCEFYLRHADGVTVVKTIPTFQSIDQQKAAIRQEMDDNSTKLASINTKTANLPTDPADASDITSSFSAVNSTLTTIAGYIDTEIAAIKASTDKLGTNVSGGGVPNSTFFTNAPTGGGATADAFYDRDPFGSYGIVSSSPTPTASVFKIEGIVGVPSRLAYVFWDTPTRRGRAYKVNAVAFIDDTSATVTLGEPFPAAPGVGNKIRFGGRP